MRANPLGSGATHADGKGLQFASILIRLMPTDPLAQRLARLGRHIQGGPHSSDLVDLSTLRVIRSRGDKAGDLRLWSVESDQTIGAFAWHRKRRSSVSLIDFAGLRLQTAVYRTEISITNLQGEEHCGRVTIGSRRTKVELESLLWPRYLSARATIGGEFSGFMRCEGGVKLPILFAADGYTLRDVLKTFVPWRAHPDPVEMWDRMTDSPLKVQPEHAASMIAIWLHARTCLIGGMPFAQGYSPSHGGEGVVSPSH